MKPEDVTFWVTVSVALHLVVGALHILAQLAARFPRWGPGRALCRLKIGPRTDVRNMTRRQLFQSAAIFLAWSGLLFATVVGLGYIVGNMPPSKPPSSLLLAALFATVLFTMTFLAAAIRLAFHGITRPKRPLHERWND